MNDKQIDILNLIILQNGSCDGISCAKCPLNNIEYCGMVDKILESAKLKLKELNNE